MPDERNYYVICDDNCRFESMTKEQIIAAIAEATGNTPTAVDDAFITKIKEQNHNRQLKFWVGTQAEYNAITTKAQDVFYLITDPSIEEEIETRVSDLEDDVEELQGEVGNIADYVIETGTSNYWSYQKWASGRITATREVQWSSIPMTDAASGGSYALKGGITLPSGMASAPFVWADCVSSTGYVVAQCANIGTSTFDLRIAKLYVGGNLDETHFAIHLEGRWK